MVLKTEEWMICMYKYIKFNKVAKLPTEFYYKVYYVVEFHRF